MERLLYWEINSSLPGSLYNQTGFSPNMTKYIKSPLNVTQSVFRIVCSSFLSCPIVSWSCGVTVLPLCDM